MKTRDQGADTPVPDSVRNRLSFGFRTRNLCIPTHAASDKHDRRKDYEYTDGSDQKRGIFVCKDNVEVPIE